LVLFYFFHLSYFYLFFFHVDHLALMFVRGWGVSPPLHIYII
jgi:hypothetical protein